MGKTAEDLKVFLEQEGEMPEDTVQSVVNWSGKLQACTEYTKGVMEEITVAMKADPNLLKFMPDAPRMASEVQKVHNMLLNAIKTLQAAQGKMQSEFGAAARAMKPDKDYSV